MSVLCTWRGSWALCGYVNLEADTCSISGGPWIPDFPSLSRLFKRVRGTVSPLAEVAFYPVVSYHGLTIPSPTLMRDDDQPRVICSVSPEFDDLQSPYFLDLQARFPARYPGDVLKRDGWAQTDRGVYEKVVHVDALEKVEGPPPDHVCFPHERRERIRARLIRRGEWTEIALPPPGFGERHIHQPTDLSGSTEQVTPDSAFDQLFLTATKANSEEVWERLNYSIAQLERLYLFGDAHRPLSPEFAVVEGRGVALLFTDPESAVRGAQSSGTGRLNRKVSLITMTPHEAAKYLDDLQQSSAEHGHPITRVIIKNGTSEYMTEIDDLRRHIEVRGTTRR